MVLEAPEIRGEPPAGLERRTRLVALAAVVVLGAGGLAAYST